MLQFDMKTVLDGKSVVNNDHLMKRSGTFTYHVLKHRGTAFLHMAYLCGSK